MYRIAYVNYALEFVYTYRYMNVGTLASLLLTIFVIVLVRVNNIMSPVIITEILLPTYAYCVSTIYPIQDSLLLRQYFIIKMAFWHLENEKLYER